MTDASHVRNAIARFDQVQRVSDSDRDQACANIKEAARHFNVDVAEDTRQDLGKAPHTSNAAHKERRP